MDSRHKRKSSKKLESSIQAMRDELEVAKKYHDLAKNGLVEAETNYQKAEKEFQHWMAAREKAKLEYEQAQLLLKRAEKKVDVIEITDEEEDDNDVDDRKPAAVTVDNTTENAVAARLSARANSSGGAGFLRSGTTATHAESPQVPSPFAQAPRRRTWNFISTGNDDYNSNTQLGISKQYAESAIRAWKSGDDQMAKSYLRKSRRHLFGQSLWNHYDSDDETENNISNVVDWISTQAEVNANVRAHRRRKAGLLTAAAPLPRRTRRRVDDTNSVLGNWRNRRATTAAGSTATASMAGTTTTTNNTEIEPRSLASLVFSGRNNNNNNGNSDQRTTTRRMNLANER